MCLLTTEHRLTASNNNRKQLNSKRQMKTYNLSLETKNIAHRLTQTLSAVEAVKELFEAQMGVDRAVVRKLLSTALHRGGDFADIHFD